MFIHLLGGCWFGGCSFVIWLMVGGLMFVYFGWNFWFFVVILFYLWYYFAFSWMIFWVLVWDRIAAGFFDVRAERLPNFSLMCRRRWSSPRCLMGIQLCHRFSSLHWVNLVIFWGGFEFTWVNFISFWSMSRTRFMDWCDVDGGRLCVWCDGHRFSNFTWVIFVIFWEVLKLHG